MGNRYKSPQGLGRLSGPALSLSFAYSAFFPSLLSAQRGTTDRTPLHSAAAAPFLEPTCERRGQKKLRKLNNRIVFFSTRRDIVESLTLYRDTHHLSRNGRHRILCLASSKSHVRFEADFKYRLRVCLLLFPLFIYFFFFFMAIRFF